MGLDVAQGLFAGLGDLSKTAQQGMVVTPGKSPFAGGQGPLAPGQLDTAGSKPKLSFTLPGEAANQNLLNMFQAKQDILSQGGGGIDNLLKQLRAQWYMKKLKGGGKGGGGGLGIDPAVLKQIEES